MRSNRLLGIALVLGLIWYGFRPASELLVDYLWFGSLEHLELFSTVLKTKVALWVVTFIVAFTFVALNTRSAWLDGPLDFSASVGPQGEVQLPPEQPRLLARRVITGVLILLGVGFANGMAERWLDVLSYFNAEGFDQADPIFGRDVGYYMFQLPVLEAVQSLAMGLCIVSLLSVGGIHFLRDILNTPSEGSGPLRMVEFGADGRPVEPIQPPRRGPGFSVSGKRHLMVLGGLLLLVMAFGFWLQRFDLLVTRRGAVFGVGYTDMHAQIPALWGMVGVSVLASVLLLLGSRKPDWRSPAVAVGLFFAAQVLLNGMFPGVVQNFKVTPNELELERPFIEHNIDYTRRAYGLDKIRVQPFDASPDLSAEDLAANPLTVENVRLWDDAPLLTTYGQLQEIRLYYDFVDVDVDRYIIDGKLRQVMLSARELNYDNVPGQARSWVNEHLQYTHGYGMTMSPVNVITEEGQPDLFVKDIPPTTTHEGIEVDQPAIYYGELTDRYVVVKTSAEEFDYPVGDENKYTNYAGTGGVAVGALWQKLLFAYHFGSVDLLLSDYLQDESRVLMRRRIRSRVARLAPFLRYDSDPYLVLNEGRLVWMIDAYTVSDRYPFSEHRGENPRSRLNYIRNAVKVVVDAYNGSVNFYVSDADDPIIAVYRNVFPDTFTSIDEMPDSLRAHVRHPEDYFDVQAELYRAYHMTDPTVFYNKEDMWDFPMELYGGKSQVMRSYYLIMKLPDAEREEFILLLPFVPTGKENMISWLAARCDGENYGELVLYQFPKQKLIYGPRQVEARIDQDPAISELITLWGQAGSRVVRGNLLVIPIEDSLLYVEPLYLQAESSQFPELKRVIVAYENQIAMRPTLEESLAAIFGGKADQFSADGLAEFGEALSADDGSGVEMSALFTSDTWKDLAGQASDTLSEAESAQKDGDWAGYGEALEQLRTLIGQLAEQAQKAESTPPSDEGEAEDPASAIETVNGAAEN